MKKASLSVISAVRNCQEETSAFLKSFEKFKPMNLREAILVDDGSEEETKSFLEGKSNEFKLLRNKESKGFAFSNNFGVSQASGDWLLFLNNDLVLKRGWTGPFDQVVEGSKKLARLGCLGNLQLDPRTGKIDHAGVTFKNGIPEHFLQGEKTFPSTDYSEFLAVTGACFMIRRELFLEVGGFDESYKTGFEDIDLCLRLAMLGCRHYVANRSRVLHKRGSTPERNEFQGHNSTVFYGRWGKLTTRLEEWERERDFSMSGGGGSLDLKRKAASHVLKRREKFLFADRAILERFFNNYLKAGKFSLAEKILNILLDNFPSNPDVISKQALLAQARGELKQAEGLFEQLSATEKESSRILLQRADLSRRLGRFSRSESLFRRLLKQQPDSSKAYWGIGKCNLARGKLAKAREAFQTCVLLDPGFSKGWKNLAEVFLQTGEGELRVNALRRYLALDPADSNAWGDLLEEFWKLGGSEEANALLQGNEERIRTAKGCLFAARVCYQVRNLNLATDFLNRGIALGENLVELFLLRGNVMVLEKRFSEAVSNYREVLTLDPDLPEALSNLANCKAFQCDWSSREEELGKLLALQENGKVGGGVFELIGLSFSEAEECARAKELSRQVLERTSKLGKALNFNPRGQPGKRPRIGFLSSDFRNHAVGHQMIGLLENLDREKFEVFLYATSPHEDSPIRGQLVEVCDSFRDLSACDLRAKATAIFEDGLDLLVDLGGFSQANNAEVLALRPAPRQAHYLGYASSMGKGLVDCVIGDKWVLPSSGSRKYAEKIVRMDGCFFPPGAFSGFAKRCKRKEVGLPAKGFVYCAFHAAYKIEPEVFRSWMRILKAVPGSVLWLKFKPAEEAIKNLRAEALRQGVSSKRIILADDLPGRPEHLSRMTVADLYLDCPLYNGHASAMDALHAKLPILTVKGNRFCNRVGESLLENLDLAELVTKDLAHYEAKAIELGLKPSLLLPLRRKISENAEQVLCPKNHTRRFEAALENTLCLPIRRVFVKKSSKTPPSRPKVSLKDLTLVMIRPHGVTNWADNVSRLGTALSAKGSSVLVLEDKLQKWGPRSEFAPCVRRLKFSSNDPCSALNQALIEVQTQYCFVLDDFMRIMPVDRFVRSTPFIIDLLEQGRTGYLGVGSSMEPHAGCLVTSPTEGPVDDGKIAGLFSPSFLLDLRAMCRVGGFRPGWQSLAMGCLDLSLRMGTLGFASRLVESEGILCPSKRDTDYLQSAPEKEAREFVRIWKRAPVGLKPKHQPEVRQIGETPDYNKWIRLCDTITKDDLEGLQEEVDRLEQTPLISVVMPVYDPSRKFLEKAIESVLSQAYPNWELCIADDASTKKYVRPLLEKFAQRDSRIKVKFRKTNGHISAASNSALTLAKGEFVAFLDHDDELRPHSLLEIAKVLNEDSSLQVIYSDEDKINEKGERYDPYFKPAWNPELFLGQNYLCHLTVIRRDLIKQVKGFRKEFVGAQDWDLFLRVTETVKPERIRHIPSILYHWRASGQSTALAVDEKDYVLTTARKCLTEAIQRRKILAEIKADDQRNSHWRIKYALPSRMPMVSVLIPFRDRVDLLEVCLRSIRRTVRYPKLEIILLDNESSEPETLSYLRKAKNEKSIRVIRVSGEFNYSKINNLGVAEANGDLVLLLNNDVEAIEPGWLEEMISHASRPEVGCVGAKLLYPDRTVQHAGVILGIGGGPGHLLKHFPGNTKGYFGNLTLVRNASAVTGACLMVRKSVYEEVGGLDEISLKVAFNDIDICLKVAKAGYLNLWTPHAELLHHESASRGDDTVTPSKRIRAGMEASCLRSRWGLEGFLDPYYNQNLTSFSEKNFFGIKPVKEKKHAAKKSEPSTASKKIRASKRHKLRRLASLFENEVPFDETGLFFDFLPPDAQSAHGIVETENVSSHGYDGHALSIIDSMHRDGLILDCGSGYRPTYYKNVVNFDPVRYPTTDVVGVGEQLPFKDNSFDAVFSLNVLEHVRDPFRCAREITRVLKPGGQLYCVVPFLCPYHGYPDHYYNMSKSGLANLFRDLLVVERQEVLDSGHPIHSLTWILRSWSESLSVQSKESFLSKKVGDLIGLPEDYFPEPFVSELTEEKKFELGATTALWAKRSFEKAVPQPEGALSQGESDFLDQEYKQTWNQLSLDFESAKLHVTGDVNEAELLASAKETILRLDNAVGVLPTDTILEIGCGIGRVGKELAPRCEKWIGCDISSNMLEYAGKRLKGLSNVELIELPESNLSPIPDNSVDLVYCTVVFMHLHEWDRFKYVQEAFRVLKPGGRAYFDNFNLLSEGGWHLFNCHYQIPVGQRPDHISKSSTPQELKEYLVRSSFDEIEVREERMWVFAFGVKPLGETSPKNLEQTFLERRKKLYGMLTGQGIEIGAFEHPAELPGSCTVEYCDVLSIEEAKNLFPEIDHTKLMQVDHIINLDREGLQNFESQSKDFIIINHVLEHLFDPINAIKECFRVLKNGGRLILSVPDKRYTFDKERPLTHIDAIQRRLSRKNKQLLPEDYMDMVNFVHKDLLEKSPDTIQDALKSFMQRREHVNIWSSETFEELLQTVIRKNSIQAKLVFQVMADENSFEYLGLWEKTEDTDLNEQRVKHLESSFVSPSKAYKDSLVLSVHIPKSGGTSFRGVLNQIYDKKLLLEYSASHEEQISNAKSIDHETACIHGHLHFEAYEQIMGDARLITWLRHPVARTVSLYNHLVSHPLAGDELHDWVTFTQPTLLEFAESELVRNYALQMLHDLSPEDFEFIGFLDSTKSSMIKCASALGWSTVPKLPHANKGSGIQTDSLSEREKKFIEGQNSEELKWYLRAKKVFG